MNPRVSWYFCLQANNCWGGGGGSQNVTWRIGHSPGAFLLIPCTKNGTICVYQLFLAHGTDLPRHCAVNKILFLRFCGWDWRNFRSVTFEIWPILVLSGKIVELFLFLHLFPSALCPQVMSQTPQHLDLLRLKPLEMVALPSSLFTKSFPLTLALCGVSDNSNLCCAKTGCETDLSGACGYFCHSVMGLFSIQIGVSYNGNLCCAKTGCGTDLCGACDYFCHSVVCRFSVQNYSFIVPMGKFIWHGWTCVH